MTTKPQPAADTTELAKKEKATPPEVLIGPHGIMLRSIDELWRFAQFVNTSDLATKGDTTATILVKIQMGAEVGLPPMASIQNIAVINGRPSIWGDAMLALCRASGLFDEAVFEETSKGSGMNMAATCTVRRLPNGNAIMQSFSMEDAKLAGLLDKNTPWKTYPRRMCQMRARSFALRDAFTDCLRGMRAVEEERDCITTHFAEQNEAKEVPAKTLDDLTDKLSDRSTINVYPSKEEMAKGDAPLNPPTAEEVEQELRETCGVAHHTRPTAEEVAADQAQLADEFAGELANAETASRVAELGKGIAEALGAGTLTHAVAAQLELLVNTVRESLSEVKG